MQTTNTNPIAMKINEIVNEEVNRLMEEKYKRYSLLEEVYQDITNLTTFKKLLITSEEKKCEPERIVKNLNNESNFMLVILDRLSSMQLQLNTINETLKHTKSSSSENIKLEIVEKESDELASQIVEEEESEESEEEEETDEEESEEEVEKTEVKDEEEEEEETSTVETETEETKEEEEELFEIELNGKTYCTDNEQNGKIYELIDDEIGQQVGYLKNGKPIFTKIL
jgi:cobalamin biosynthesis protein CobT